MKQNRAYAILNVRAVEEGEAERIIRGVATTPTPDRMGDVIEPLGVNFTNPMPLLWQHEHDKPVGHAWFGKPKKDGISFEAKLPRIDEAGALRDRIEEAWQSVKSGLVAAVSIGFRPMADAFEIMRDGGIRFMETEVLELSLVTIPANAEATITLVKSLDRGARAATGQTPPKSVKRAASGDKRNYVVRSKQMTKKSIADQIADWEETRRQKSMSLEEIIGKSAEGQTLDAAEQEEFDTVAAEIDQIDEQIKRLNVLAKQMATTVKAAGEGQVPGNARAIAPVQVKAPAPAPGIRFARYARCIALSQKNHRDVSLVAEDLYGQRDPELVGFVKAAVTAINTTTDAALIGNDGGFADFVSFLRPKTIVGKFGQNGIPALRPVPFRVPLISQATGGVGYWVGEGKAKPLTKQSFARTELLPMKVANIAVATMEALRDSSPSAEMVIRDDLAAAVIEAQDLAFIDPTNAGTAGVKPASILDGITPVPSGGQDADAVRDDARRAMLAFVTAKNPLTAGVWIMSASTALSLSTMVNPFGQPEFPGMTVNGGTFMGLPTIVSEAVDGYAALVNASDIWVADDGGVDVKMSTEASLEMLDNPTNDSITPTATTLVSMFQTNSVAFLAERTINWKPRRASAASYVSGVSWGVGAS